MFSEIVAGHGSLRTSVNNMSQDRFALAEQFYREQKYQDAETELLQLLQTNPDDPRIHYALACTYTQLKKGDQAVEEFQKVITLAPQSKEAENSREWLEHYSSPSAESKDVNESQHDESSQDNESNAAEMGSTDTAADIIYCGQCGKSSPLANRYCGSCGTDLTTVVLSSDADDVKSEFQSSKRTYVALKNSIVFLVTSSVLFLAGYAVKQTLFTPKKAQPVVAKDSSLKKKEEKLYEKYPGTFVCPESYAKELQISDIENLSDEDLRLCRNEIYARYGFPFGVKDLSEHFEKLPWYKRNEKYDISMLSKIEKRNAKFISDYEKEREETANNVGEGIVEEEEGVEVAESGNDNPDIEMKQSNIPLKAFECIKLSPANDAEEKAFSIIDYAWKTQVDVTKRLKNLDLSLSPIQKSNEVQQIQAAQQVATQSLQYGLEQLSLASGTSKLQIVLSQLRANCPM